jgi:sterol desaturase/sphingolipid hydroxylase (fatty acid hydroxylase superfamily)
MVFSLACIVLAVELVSNGWDDSALRRLCRPSKSELIDLLMFAIYAGVLGGPMVVLWSLGTSLLLDRVGQWWAAHAPCAASGPIGFVLWLIVADFMNYWLHRAFHSRWLWPIHRTHHTAERLNPLVMHRAHPANHAADGLIRTIPLAVFPVPSSWLAAAMAFSTFYQLFIHSDLPWSLGLFGRWILCSPAGHAIHHSHDPQHYNRNIGGQMVLWDRLFGTWTDPTDLLSRTAEQRQT